MLTRMIDWLVAHWPRRWRKPTAEEIEEFGLPPPGVDCWLDEIQLAEAERRAGLRDNE